MVGDVAQGAGLESRADVVDALTNRIDELVLHIEGALKAAVPLYQAIDDPGFDQITREALQTAIRTFAGLLADPDRDELEPAARDYFAAVAESAAAQFMPLSGLEDPVRVGCRVLRGWTVGHCATSAAGLSTAVEVIGRLADCESIVSRVLTEAYVAARYHPDLEERELQRDLVETLIKGRPLDRHGLTMLAGSFGLSTTDSCVVGVAQVRGRDSPSLREIIDMGQRGQGTRGVLVVDRTDDIVSVIPLSVIPAGGFLKDGRRELSAVQDWVHQLRRIHQIDVVVGVSTPGMLADIPDRYSEARQALRFLKPEHQGVIDMAQVGLFEYLTAHLDPTAERLVPSELAQLIDDDQASGGALAQTLVAFADADLNVGRTAQDLFVHANTVHYRLKRISQLTGRNPKRFRDLVDLLIAVEGAASRER